LCPYYPRYEVSIQSGRSSGIYQCHFGTCRFSRRGDLRYLDGRQIRSNQMGHWRNGRARQVLATRQYRNTSLGETTSRYRLVYDLLVLLSEDQRHLTRQAGISKTEAEWQARRRHLGTMCARTWSHMWDHGGRRFTSLVRSRVWTGEGSEDRRRSSGRYGRCQADGT
jgi:hypothetical protein